MGIKRHRPEEIVSKLRQVEVLVGQGRTQTDAIRATGVTEQTYYRWRKAYGGMGTEQLRELKRLQKGERAPAPGGLGPDAGQADPGGGGEGKLLSPARRRRCIERVRQAFRVSERRACRVLGQHRSTQRRVPHGRADEARLVADMIELARQYGPLRISPDRGPAAGRRLAGERQAGGAPLAARRAQGSPEAAEEAAAVAARRLVRAVAAGPSGPRLVVRLRAPPHGRRPGVPDPEHPGRVHPGMPADPGPPQARLVGRAGSPCRSCSFSAACPASSGRITALSSWPGRSGAGS